MIDSDPVKTTNRSCSPDAVPTLELVNKELINDGWQGSLSNRVAMATLSVNGLTASWTHVIIIGKLIN